MSHGLEQCGKHAVVLESDREPHITHLTCLALEAASSVLWLLGGTLIDHVGLMSFYGDAALVLEHMHSSAAQAKLLTRGGCVGRQIIGQQTVFTVVLAAAPLQPVGLSAKQTCKLCGLRGTCAQLFHGAGAAASGPVVGLSCEEIVVCSRQYRFVDHRL